MNVNLNALNNPIALKLGAGAALYLFGGGSKMSRLAAAALAAWGVWDYLHRPKVVYQTPAIGPAVPQTPWVSPHNNDFGRLR